MEYQGDDLPAALLELADEMAEDPRCRFVAAGADAAGVVLFSVWDGNVGAEVDRWPIRGICRFGSAVERSRGLGRLGLISPL